jgi:hypothetical protein
MTFARQTQQEDYKEMQRLLRKLEHREAPSGFQSVTGHDPPPGTREPETELIIYATIRPGNKNFKGGNKGTKKKAELKVCMRAPKGGVHKKSAGAKLQANGKYR